MECPFRTSAGDKVKVVGFALPTLHDGVWQAPEHPLVADVRCGDTVITDANALIMERMENPMWFIVINREGRQNTAAELYYDGEISPKEISANLFQGRNIDLEEQKIGVYKVSSVLYTPIIER